MLKKCDSLPKYHKPYNEFRDFLQDNSGKILYKFNSLGYRGEEFNPKAKKKIFISGCSYTFGYGLNLEDTWGYQFKKLLSINEKLDINEINLLNFAISGHSNDYIVRSLIIQSSCEKPDLIIAYFTHPFRMEYHDKSGHHNLKARSSNVWLDDTNEELSKDFLVFYNDELGLVQTLKNMLLLQYFCKSNEIDYIIGLQDIELFNEFSGPWWHGGVAQQFKELIDIEHFYNFNLEKIDIAADNAHPGPKSNKIFAEKLFEFYKNRFTNHNPYGIVKYD